MASQFDVAFKERELKLYLKAGEFRKLLSPIDREVFRVVHGPKLTPRRPITLRRIEKATGLSPMATLFALYRLESLGIVKSSKL